MTEVLFEFLWEGYKPDQRQYRNQSIELMPLGYHGTSVLIAVPVPLEHELIYNYKDIIQVMLGSLNGVTEPPQPILTMQGMKYVIDKFDALFVDEDKKAATTDDENWGDDLPPAKSAEPAKVEAEDWDNDTKKPDEVPWEENDEQWDKV